MYCLVQDNDCHWYVIPFHKLKEWSEYLDQISSSKDYYHYPNEPEWAEAVGGSPSLVIFTTYKII